jgi:transposase-like protein
VGSRGRSRPGVSAGSRPLRTDVEAWPRRALSALTIGALCLDAIDLAVRQGTDEQDGVRCASGILAMGQPGLWHLALGSRESADAWLSFLHDRTARGLKALWLVSADGQPGLRQALPARSQAGGREVVPRAGHQRCQVPTRRHLLAQRPQAARALLKPLLQQGVRAATDAQGLTRGRALLARWRARDPAAMACLEQDLEACLVSLQSPRAPHTSRRTTPRLERTFEQGGAGRW